MRPFSATESWMPTIYEGRETDDFTNLALSTLELASFSCLLSHCVFGYYPR
jgi:hypothetical protein